MRPAVMRRYSPHDMTTRIQPRPRICQRFLLAFVAAAMVVVGCGQAPDASPGSGRQSYRDDSWGFPACDDVPELSAPPGAYRDSPVYVANEMPKDVVRAWAKEQPGYEGLWLDRERNGWITVAFSRDAAARQEDLEEEFPDVGVVAVAVDHTRERLEALADRVRSELAPFLEPDAHSVGVDGSKGAAYLEVVALTEQLRGEIERRFSGEPLCVSGSDPASLPPLGPQPEGGEGWRLLADEKGGGRNWWPVGLATEAADLAEFWVGLDAPVPEVDFEEHVVIAFGAVVSSSCPRIRLDDVVVDGSLVYPEIADLNRALACTADAVPHAYVVALERSRLPSGPFVIQTKAELPSYAKVEERLRVDVDLSEPGAVAGAGAVRPEASVAKPERSARLIEPEFSWPHWLDARCGIEWLGEVNNVVWRTDEAMPEEWEEHVDEDGGLVLAITMRVGPEPSIEAELGGETVVYEPSQGEIPECDQP